MSHIWMLKKGWPMESRLLSSGKDDLYWVIIRLSPYQPVYLPIGLGDRGGDNAWVQQNELEFTRSYLTILCSVQNLTEAEINAEP